MFTPSYQPLQGDQQQKAGQQHWHPRVHPRHCKEQVAII